jgi:predicted RNA-binding protein YlqC (UPF0109 family)
MSSSIDVQFIEFVVKSLVNNPDAVKIERRIDEKGVLLELTVDPEDLGRVIGKRGATAQSIRTLLRALGTKNDARYNLKIIDNGTYESRPRRDDAPAASSDNQTADAPAKDEGSTETPTEQPEPQTEAPAQEENTEEPEESDTSDRISKTRAELEDLDDLDV